MAIALDHFQGRRNQGTEGVQRGAKPVQSINMYVLLLDTPSRFSDNAPPLISDMYYNLWLPPRYNETLALGVCSMLWGVNCQIDDTGIF